jgi:L-arabinose isomerase
MKRSTRIGLLPLYLALYDEVKPEVRPEMAQFAADVARWLGDMSFEVAQAGICRLRSEVEAAVSGLDESDLLMTLHLAYSPSLESADILANSRLPLVMLDTTPAARFGEDATGDDMFRNHGIHGVQDLASVLRRRSRPYLLCVGHLDDPEFAAEVRFGCRSARAARALGRMRVVVIGDDFDGMGDFAVSPELLGARLGVHVERISVSELALEAREVSEAEVSAEVESDRGECDCSTIDPAVVERTNRVGLAVRRLLERHDAGAFSFNFASFTGSTGIETVPFLEASKAMARGVGYAGEADALTAALIGSLAQAGCTVTFTEMFCPDWEGGSIFMSHMGECALHMSDGPAPLVEKSFKYSDVQNPAIATPKMRPGEATLVNIAPGPERSFSLITARVEVLDRGPAPNFTEAPHFWIRPLDGSLRNFLRAYSEVGGTHHLAMCMGDETEMVAGMAQLLGMEHHAV